MSAFDFEVSLAREIVIYISPGSFTGQLFSISAFDL
jgi:hypothetical protein